MTKPTAQPPKDNGIPPRGRPENFGTGQGDRVGNVVSRRVGKDGPRKIRKGGK
jgi:hypothetical protein